MRARAAAARPWVVEVHSVGALRELEPEWADLCADARGVTPFLHPAWLLPWCETFDVERVCAAVVRNRSDGRLIAVLPSYMKDDEPDTLALLGGDVSDHRGPVIRAGAEAEAGRALFAWAQSRHGRAVFDDLPPDHPWAAGRLPAGWRRTSACVCPGVGLPASVEAWRDGMSHRLRRNVRRYRERIQRLARVEPFVADERNVGEVIEAFVMLHGARWSARGQPGVLDTAAVQRFHRLSAPRLQRAGLLRLHGSRLDRRIVAVQHVLVHGRRACGIWRGTIPR